MNIETILKRWKTRISNTATANLGPGRFFLGIKSDALLRVRVGVNKLKGQVCLQFPAHSAQHQLHFDAVADDDAQQVVDVAGVDEGGGGKVRLVPHLAQGRIEAEAAGAGAILNIPIKLSANPRNENQIEVEIMQPQKSTILTCMQSQTVVFLFIVDDANCLL